MTSLAGVAEYCRTLMAGAREEQLWLLFLNTKAMLIADELLYQGTIDHVPVYPREIVRRALELDASALILAHNHPSGDATPSREDILMTGNIINACKPLEIKVLDHIVVTESGFVSLRKLGYLL